MLQYHSFKKAGYCIYGKFMKNSNRILFIYEIILLVFSRKDVGFENNDRVFFYVKS